jgi:hypothetical protein
MVLNFCIVICKEQCELFEGIAHLMATVRQLLVSLGFVKEMF